MAPVGRLLIAVVVGCAFFVVVGVWLVVSTPDHSTPRTAFPPTTPTTPSIPPCVDATVYVSSTTVGGSVCP